MIKGRFRLKRIRLQRFLTIKRLKRTTYLLEFKPAKGPKLNPA